MHSKEPRGPLPEEECKISYESTHLDPKKKTNQEQWQPLGNIKHRKPKHGSLKTWAQLQEKAEVQQENFKQLNKLCFSFLLLYWHEKIHSHFEGKRLY